MLNGGIVPNIFSNDDLIQIRDEKYFKDTYKKSENAIDSPEEQIKFLYNRIKDNMHLSICMSPVGETFSKLARAYPALINNTTIDWFMAWQYEALIEVANKFVG